MPAVQGLPAVRYSSAVVSVLPAASAVSVDTPAAAVTAACWQLPPSEPTRLDSQLLDSFT